MNAQGAFLILERRFVLPVPAIEPPDAVVDRAEVIRLLGVGESGNGKLIFLKGRFVLTDGKEPISQP